MSALQRAAASSEVATFLSCCDDVVRKGAQTLSVSAVLHRLSHLEEEWTALRADTNLSVSARTQALQHYYNVYNACAHTVPLAQAVWDRWGTGMTSCFLTGDGAETSAAPLEALRADLVMQYWGLYCRVFWGCTCSVKARFAFAVEQAHLATHALLLAKGEPSETGRCTSAESSPVSQLQPPSQDLRTVESLESALAAPLHTFARLAHDMAHLFGDYGVVGAVERQWLNDEVATQLGDAVEGAVEALVRRSYKRDLQVPSASLPSLLQEYEEHELDEKKAQEVVALGQKTLQSAWMRAAVALHQHLTELADRAATSAPEAAPPSTTNALSSFDDKAYELMDDLLRELRKAPHSHGSLPALGALTHRLVEWPPSSSPTDNHSGAFLRSPGLNGSQTQFYLLLLHQWFARYITSQHRWSVTDMFNAADDSDLWSFVLDRHTVCLLWGLSTFESSNEATAHEVINENTVQLFMTSIDSKIDKLRAVFYSIAHCTQLYRAAVMVFTNPEKRAVRLETARAMVHEWMQRMGVAVFCRGLLGDLLDTTEAWEDANVQTPSIQLWTLRAEAEIKIVMYDTMELLGCAENSTERLTTLLEVALELCTTWKTTLTGRGSDAPVTSSLVSLFAPTIALVVRVLQRTRVKLQSSFTTAAKTTDISSIYGSPASEVKSADMEQYVDLVDKVKQFFSIVGAYMKPDELTALWDEYLFLMAMVTSATSSTLKSDENTAAPAFPSLVCYTSSTKRAFGGPAPIAGGLDDISWQRRNQAKLHRRTIEEARNGEEKTTSAELEEGRAPFNKKARTEVEE